MLSDDAAFFPFLFLVKSSVEFQKSISTAEALSTMHPAEEQLTEGAREEGAGSGQGGTPQVRMKLKHVFPFFFQRWHSTAIFLDLQRALPRTLRFLLCIWVAVDTRLPSRRN